MSEPPDLRIANPDDPSASDVPLGSDNDAAEGEGDFVDRLILPYVEDSTLWPVLIVIVVHVIAFLAPLVLFTVRDGSIFAGIGLLWILFLSVQLVRSEARRGRSRGAIVWVVLVTWALTGAAAYFGHRADIL